MAITVHLDEVLKVRGMTSKELCAIVGITCALECNVGNILQCDGELEAEHEE